jgi:carboxypeptidase C (cathepsin A)
MRRQRGQPADQRVSKSAGQQVSGSASQRVGKSGAGGSPALLRWFSMYTLSSRLLRLRALFAVCALCCLGIPAAQLAAQSDQPAASAENANKPAAGDKTPPKPEAAKDELPPLPPEAHADQTMVLDGKTIHYTVTVGALPVRDKDGKVAGEVVVTAYTMPGKDRPVTFAFNGGPGAASVFLNFGAIGPKHLQFGNEGDSPSDPTELTDNQGTWLDFSDLVFVDPIGTGFSRSKVSEDETKKLFYATEPDIEYLSRIVYDWLVKNDRMESRKYLVGESYGGFRGPRITYFLQSQLGVAMNGVVLVSPYLNPTEEQNGNLSPIPWMVTLPSITAANLEREHKLTPEAMQDVIAYTEGDYAATLIKGPADKADNDKMIAKVTEMTGLDPEFVKYAGGRLSTGAYLREVHREEGKLGSIYDSNVTSYDPFPYAPEQEANDPILASSIAPVTTAMVNFITNTVGWKVDARYNALSYDVNRAWTRDDELRSGSATQLRQAVAADPKLRVMIVHGWNDLSCPFMGSILTVNQIPVMGDPTRVSVHEFPGGHMFYTRESSRVALRKDVMEMFAQH